MGQESLEMLVHGAKMRDVMRLVYKVAARDATLLIGGETGVGKELVARAIHKKSNRRGPFVVVECNAQDDQLIRSELFGHEKGSFTGAIEQKIGLFEVACGGTIFIDEISESSSQLQARLLRVIETKEFRRIGGVKMIYSDARIIAATNKDLKALVEDRGFRSDLYYRLNVVMITIPPLRERPEDIPALAQFFVEKSGSQKTIGHATLEYMLNYDWPGNVRELKNAIERAILIGDSAEILIDDLFDNLSHSSIPSSNGRFHTLEELEKDQIVRALQTTGGNKLEAARLLGIHRTSIYDKMKRYGIEISAFNEAE